jgi:hypothetical protein
LDIALLVETWFCCKHNDRELASDGFTLFQSDRIGVRMGGGLTASVRSNIHCIIWAGTKVRKNDIEIM